VVAKDERIQNALAKRLLSNDRDAHDRILEDLPRKRGADIRHPLPPPPNRLHGEVAVS
jgi:hypothetical protein